jgi:uncharacterized membrane protein YdjX (TVP38/TMEM64 family)
MSIFREAVAALRSRRGVALMLAAVAGAVLVWVFRTELIAVAREAAGWIRAAGPAVYFTVMALVPLPLAWFTVAAGELFAEKLTLAGVMAASMTAVVVQLSLSYAVARYGVRPVVVRWLQRRGHAVPAVTRENAASMVLLVRLLPGPPMILGSCLLAVAEAPFAIYLLLSALVALPWVCAGVMLGHGLMNGEFTQVLTGAGVLAVVVIGVRIYRKRRVTV